MASIGDNADARNSSAVFIDPQQMAMVLAMLSPVAYSSSASPFCNTTTIVTRHCRFTSGSRAPERRGFVASSNKADARHYSLLYIYNPQ